MVLVLGATASAAGAGSPPTIARTGGLGRRFEVRVASTHTWTPVGITMRRGESAQITAAGVVHFGAGRIGKVGAAGLAWGPQCFTLGATTRASFPATGLPCYSLIARVGNGRVRKVGASGTIRADAAGALFLGVNDNYLSDNVGSWSATIDVAAPGAQLPSAANAGGRHTSSTVPVGPIAVGVLALMLVVAAFVLNSKRRPVFALDSGLLGGHVRIRVGPSGGLERVVSNGDVIPFDIARDDFDERMPDHPQDRFGWRGLNFLAPRPRFPWTRSRGEVQRVGQHVAGSGGMVRGRDRFMRGVVPLSVRPAWLFTFDSAAARNDEGYLEGELALIASESRFDADVSKLTRSLTRLPKGLRKLVAAREPTISMRARVSSVVDTNPKREASRPKV